MLDSEPWDEDWLLDEERLELLLEEGSDGIDADEGDEAPGSEGEELDDEEDEELGMDGADEGDDDGEELGIEGMPLELELCCVDSQAPNTRASADAPSKAATRRDLGRGCGMFMVASVSFEGARDPEVPPGPVLKGPGRQSSDFGRGRSTPARRRHPREGYSEAFGVFNLNGSLKPGWIRRSLRRGRSWTFPVRHRYAAAPCADCASHEIHAVRRLFLPRRLSLA